MPVYQMPVFPHHVPGSGTAQPLEVPDCLLHMNSTHCHASTLSPPHVCPHPHKCHMLQTRSRRGLLLVAVLYQVDIVREEVAQLFECDCLNDWPRTHLPDLQNITIVEYIPE